MTNQSDKTLTQILEALQPENNLGVLLMAQMGGTPQELQLILQTTEYDEEKEALRTTGQYIIRVIGVLEHKLSLGLFNNLAFSTENPVLHRYNEPLVEVYYRGKLDDPDPLMLELYQLYGQTYGIYRHMADEVNHAMPFGKLLTQGHGLVATMPKPFAEKTKALFARYDLEVSFMDSEIKQAEVPHQLLVMDDAYFIAQMFSADPMGKSGV